MTGPTPYQLPEMTPLQGLWRGTITALVVALPAGILNQFLIDSGDVEAGSPVTLLFVVLILFGGASGGWAVIRLAPTARLAHAAGAAALAYVIVQTIGVVIRLISGDDISWLSYPFLALLMATCGMLGGMFARRWVMKNLPPG
ncbi:hypothetical protein BH10ACT3_BH10ACT3_24660 [soil metagenome]